MSLLALDAALAQPPAEVGRSLLGLGEDQWFDRKSARVTAKDLAVAVCALANAEGGAIVIGLHGGRVEGIGTDPVKENELRQASVDFIRPPARMHVQVVPCLNDDGAADRLLLCRVDPGETVHELTNGDCYLRVGDESRKLTYTQRQELHYDRGQAPFDGQAVLDCGIDSLDPARLDAYRAAAGASDTYERLLHARSLLTPRDEVTVAAWLLFADAPQERFPNAHVRVLRYQSEERGTGSRLSLGDDTDQRVDGPIPEVIATAADLIGDWIPKRRALDASGHFVPRPIVPRDAWLEGLVNAVIHRSYSMAGDHIRVEIFPNRIEIESPGRFPGLADPRRPLEISRYARNPRIARVCADLRIGQELGEGIKRIFDEMRLLGLAEPMYTQSPSSTRLVLLGTSRIDPAITSRLPQATTILAALTRAGRPLGTGDVIELTGLSRPTVTRHLAGLRDEGVVTWTGKSPQDPRAVWSVRH